MDIVESGYVAPAEVTPRHSIWLSNLDLLVARAHAPTVYFYRPGGDPGEFFSPEVLKNALAKTLVPFYPMAGRLRLDPTGRVEIRCTGEGALFVVARSDATVDDFGDFAPSSEMRQMLVPSVESGDMPCALAMFQVTFFKCGGVCLGTALHHTAVDGLGALYFINAWADASRGIELAVSPFLDRTFLRARSPLAVLFDHVEYSPKPPAEATAGKTPFVSAIFKLSKEELNSLKSKGTAGKRVSTFKAVSAHVWRSACKARSLPDDQESRFYMTADARTRTYPQMPPVFLGNAILRTSAVAKVGDVLSSTIQFGVEKIDGAAARVTDEFVRSLVDYLEQQPDVRGLQKGSWAMPRTDLWVISWQGLPIYEADFGWGKPVFMGRACLQFAGLVYLMNNPGGDGGLSLAVALEPEAMLRFKKVFYEDL